MAWLLITKTVHKTRIGRTENVKVNSSLLHTAMKGCDVSVGLARVSFSHSKSDLAHYKPISCRLLFTAVPDKKTHTPHF